jgi:hypothetical protein
MAAQRGHSIFVGWLVKTFANLDLAYILLIVDGEIPWPKCVCERKPQHVPLHYQTPWRPRVKNKS